MDTGSKSGVRSQKSEVKKDRKQGARKTNIFYITVNGLRLAQKLRTLYPDAQIVKFTSVMAIHELPLHWNECKALVFIMASGIVVRSIAPLIKDKKTDPAVLVLDEKGSFVISLLSGHIGGANGLARKIADYLGAQAVITTASDVQGRLALDIWAMERGLYIEDFEKMKRLSVKIVAGKTIKVHSDCRFESENKPPEFRMVDSPQDADLIISHRTMNSRALFLRPKKLFAGIGCNRNTGVNEIEDFVGDVFQREGLSLHSIGGLASIDLKQDEKGLLDFAHAHKVGINFYSKEELNSAASKYNITESKAVRSATGAAAVAEPAAILCARRISDKVSLIIPKEKRGNVTLAIAKAKFTL